MFIKLGQYLSYQVSYSKSTYAAMWGIILTGLISPFIVLEAIIRFLLYPFYALYKKVM